MPAKDKKTEAPERPDLDELQEAAEQAVALIKRTIESQDNPYGVVVMKIAEAEVVGTVILMLSNLVGYERASDEWLSDS